MSVIENIRRSLRSIESVSLTKEELIESAQRSNRRGIPIRDFDNLGISFGAVRLDRRITVEELSRLTGVKREDIIDLELGGFLFNDAVEIAGKLRESLGITPPQYLSILSSSRPHG